MTREQTSRDAQDEAAMVDDWEPTAFTSAPPPRPGMEQRWVRFRNGGSDDLGNVVKRRHYGWEPRSADTLPAGYIVNVAPFAGLAGTIQNQDSILMERSVQRGDKVRSMIHRQTARMDEAVRGYVSRQMPAQHGTVGGSVEKIEIETTVGNRRVPNIAD